ncbi:hypothetical protein BH10ACI3_BH10ACI3_20310 [soil metagenome]
MSKPFFSVVIPTRNRAALLPYAVGSVLAQTFGDLEVIISDNFSSDETPEIGRSFDDRRVKYFRSERPLSIGESFEFALGHATGEYTAFLSDDDAQAKVCLENFHRLIIAENAQIVACRLTPYFAEDCYCYGRQIKRQSLAVMPFTREVTVLDKVESLTALFAAIGLTTQIDKAKSVKFPQLVNAVYKTELFTKLQQRIPILFPALGSDIYTTALFFNIIDRFYYIDEPLYLYRIWDGSETTGKEEFFKRHPEESLMDHVPLKKTVSVGNYHVNTVLRAASEWGEDYFPVNIDWGQYFAARYQDIREMAQRGLDVSEELEEFETVLLKQTLDIQKRATRRDLTVPIKDFLRLKVRATFIGSLMLKINYPGVKLMSHKTDGFANIIECAELIDGSFLQKYSSKTGNRKFESNWM